MPARFVPNPKLGTEIIAHFGDLIEQSAFVMERETKRRTPVDTGHLRNSFHADVERGGGAVHAEVGSNVEYAAYVEHGTSKMEGHHMLSNSVGAAGRWLASRGFRVEYVANRGGA